MRLIPVANQAEFRRYSTKKKERNRKLRTGAALLGGAAIGALAQASRAKQAGRGRGGIAIDAISGGLRGLGSAGIAVGGYRALKNRKKKRR